MSWKKQNYLNAVRAFPMVTIKHHRRAIKAFLLSPYRTSRTTLLILQIACMYRNHTMTIYLPSENRRKVTFYILLSVRLAYLF